MNTQSTSAKRSTTQSKKVGLDELIFTMSWEDGDLDRAVFAPLGKGARLATVASGGCNALTFLLDDPAEIFAFDYNPTQVHLVELKRAAFLALEHAELLELFGVRPSKRRVALLARVESHLSPAAIAYFKQLPWLVTDGLLGGGRYERFVSWFRVMLRTVQGARTVDALFFERSAHERRRFYDESWDGAVWRLLFRAFFNKRVLASRGLSADYFHFAGGSRSPTPSRGGRSASSPSWHRATIPSLRNTSSADTSTRSICPSTSGPRASTSSASVCRD